MSNRFPRRDLRAPAKGRPPGVAPGGLNDNFLGLGDGKLSADLISYVPGARGRAKLSTGSGLSPPFPRPAARIEV